MTEDKILSLEAIAKRLKREPSLSYAARATGIHYNQIWRIASGTDSNIRYANLKKLSDYFTKSQPTGTSKPE